jgi:dTDP-4-amino-4,6-dideoxygalactose transaminase
LIPIAKPLIGEEEKKAAAEALSSGMIAEGPRVAEFEKRFAKYCGARFAVATSNGTTALHSALLAHGVGPGDEVITTPFTFIASANTVIYCGAKPVFADIGEDFNLDPSKIAAAITPKTKAILPVHLYGNPCAMKQILEIAGERGIAVIEDACQAHGAEVSGRRAGSLGSAGCFSFYPTKNMTSGEGGMVVTSDEGVAERCRMLRSHGSRERYRHEALGFNYRLTDINAAIGLEQLKKLEGFNAARISNARTLNEALSGAGGIALPEARAGTRHVFNQYTVRVKPEFGLSRDALAGKLKEEGIGTGIYYPLTVPQQELYRNLGLSGGSFPNAERAAKEVLSLPVHPGVGVEGLKKVAEAVARFAR